MARSLSVGFSGVMARSSAMGCSLSMARSSMLDFSSVLARSFLLGFSTLLARSISLGCSWLALIFTSFSFCQEYITTPAESQSVSKWLKLAQFDFQYIISSNLSHPPDSLLGN